jgi:hypothetical protein
MIQPFCRGVDAKSQRSIQFSGAGRRRLQPVQAHNGSLFSAPTWPRSRPPGLSRKGTQLTHRSVARCARTRESAIDRERLAEEKSITGELALQAGRPLSNRREPSAPPPVSPLTIKPKCSSEANSFLRRLLKWEKEYSAHDGRAAREIIGSAA